MPALLKIDAYRGTPVAAAPDRLLSHSAPPSGLSDGHDNPVVLVVDDDDEVRASLCELLESVGIAAVGFAAANRLLETDLLDAPGCLILDVRMPGLSGLAFQEQLIARGVGKPIIFLTGHGDIPMTAKAMKAGAADFLTKPVRDQTLLDAVTLALAADVRQRAENRSRRHSLELYATLTPRERQVLEAVAQGRLNKCTAFDLGISEVTVKLHRSSVMRKMGARSVADLVRAWQSLPVDAQREIAHEPA
ncbi:response regulator transcription factor [Caulobacter sp. CCG-8]|uniref:response regulator transcription factor n=1 Tax=Caulobacter sp. CCG-8 TaxID=3127958 RepID=UPI00307D4779